MVVAQGAEPPDVPDPSYACDVVFCIDCTGSMRPYRDSAKAVASWFPTGIRAWMVGRNINIRELQLRVRLIAFGDLCRDGDEALVETPFFTLPDHADAFEAVVDRLVQRRRGDGPASALEALAVAILRSDWERSRDKRRHVVVLCTAAPAHPLGKFPMAGATDGDSRPFPASLEELRAIWGDEDDEGDMEYAAKRLIVLGPSVYPWSDFTGIFENCIWVESAAGADLHDTDIEDITQSIFGSV